MQDYSIWVYRKKKTINWDVLRDKWLIKYLYRYSFILIILLFTNLKSKFKKNRSQNIKNTFFKKFLRFELRIKFVK